MHLLFRAGPKFLSLFQAGPGSEKSSSCKPVLEGDKVKEKKHNHPCIQEHFRGADSLFYLLLNLYMNKKIVINVIHVYHYKKKYFHVYSMF